MTSLNVNDQPRAQNVKHPPKAAFRPTDGGWGWVVVFGSSVCHFFLLGIARTLGIVFILMRERFHASAKGTALVAAIFVCIRSGGGPVASLLSDRFGCRRVACTGGLLLFAGVALSAFASSLGVVCVTFGLIGGVGSMLLYSPSYIIVSYWFDKNKGKAMSLSTIGTGLGSIVMAFVMTGLTTEYQYFGTMLIVGALMLNSCVGAVLYLNPPTIKTPQPPIIIQLCETTSADCQQRNSPDAETEVGLSQTTAENNNDVTNERLTSQTRYNAAESTVELSTAPARKTSRYPPCLRSTLWHNVPFIIHCLMMCGLQGCIQSVIIFIPSYASELGASVAQEAWVLTAFGLADLAGRFVAGFLFDVKWARPRRAPMYATVSILFAVFAMVMTLTQTYLWLTVVTVLMAFFEGGAHSQRATIIPELVETEQMSMGVGIGFFFMGVGNLYGPVAGGALKDLTATYKYSFLFGGAIYLSFCLMNVVYRVFMCHRRHVARRNNAEDIGRTNGAKGSSS